ncbi:MAG: cysteine hydrolase [Cellvibrionaceae bacterium]|nr:cysteine hydrolase [Cellvibrionaceae bacterium]MCV6628154.1 cysteine hydrolase [Cellvibrionaceae bacterium]
MTITTRVFGFAAMLALALSPLAQAGEGLKINKASTALLITDPQNDFLSEQGVAYGLVKDNLKKLGTIDNIGKLFKGAKKTGMAVFVSPHTLYPHDEKWQARGELHKTMHKINMFHASGPIVAEKFEGSGADFLERYKPYINDGKTTVTSPHKVYGPESNDLVLQLRKQGIQTVILGGMAANLCTDSHMRELMEQGFEVIVVKDAVGAPGEAAYQAALTNYGLIANAVVDTQQALALMH